MLPLVDRWRRTQKTGGFWILVCAGRTDKCTAQLFQSVEVKPQAMEWILSMAARYRFRVSIDNLNGTESDTSAFKQAVYQQVKTYCEKGLSVRAETLRRALCDFYGSPLTLKIEDFDLESL